MQFSRAILPLDKAIINSSIHESLQGIHTFLAILYSFIRIFSKTLFPHLYEKVVLLGGKQPFLLHFADFVGKGAAVHTQVFGQLLPVKGDFHFPGTLAQHLGGQIRGEPAPDGFWGRVEHPPGQVEVLPG